MEQLPKQYNPQETEDKWYKFWEKKGYFRARVNPDKKPFCIVIPPPNVTGILHMGHALNNTIQDILIRYQRMQGRQALWMPGTDHAGIATQNVVEKEIAKDGLKRQDLGRERFLARIWQWKEQYGSTIIHQLKKLGASCDWSRTRFTMDDEYSRAIREVFVTLWNKGLIYQDDKVINWCPRCQTALADEEAPHREIDGYLYYIKYPLKESIVHSPQSVVKKFKSIDYRLSTIDYIVVATTRPETMLGDTAVAVNPRDKRYKKVVGKILILPLINREIKIIADDIVDKKFGTGAVKVTPAHDSNDYLLGKKHGLDFINIMHPDGRLNEKADNYKGMDRFQAREVVLKDLKKNRLLQKVLPHKLSAGHCYRCHTIIEPYLSRQWFVKMKPLAKPAIEVVKRGKVKFYPERWTKVYLNWMENIQDWCISRQIWWGHRLPVYYCDACTANRKPCTDTKTVNGKRLTVNETYVIVSRSKPEKCPRCGNTDLKQDEDVLDTWFSSWLWPFATFYWPPEAQSAERKAQSERELKYFYPTSVLVTAPEIIFFWVARMIIAGLEFMKNIPFRNVYIHGTVRDIKGKKMSKSLGNAIDPLEIISEYGTDALRFSLASCASQGDLFLSKEKFEMGRNFANKIWNASRFILMNLDTQKTRGELCAFFRKENLKIYDHWILSRFYSTLIDVNRYLNNYRFNEAANLLYAFLWHEFCDWYLELAKPVLVNSKQLTVNIKKQKEITQVILYTILEKFLRILHPFMPFITEEIWQKLPHEGESIMVQPWPHVQENIIDKKTELQMELVINIIKSIRYLRSQIELKPNQKVSVSVYPHKKINQQLIENNIDLITYLAKLETLKILDSSTRLSSTISAISGSVDIYLHFRGLIDIANEQQKITEKIVSLAKMIGAKEARLKNVEFVKKAPPEVVSKEKESINILKDESRRLEKMFNELH
jgi:valyl-tRNA synthetase